MIIFNQPQYKHCLGDSHTKKSIVRLAFCTYLLIHRHSYMQNLATTGRYITHHPDSRCCIKDL